MTELKSQSERDALRERLGLTPAELTRRAGISIDTVRKILRGEDAKAVKVLAVDNALAQVAREKGIDVSIVGSTLRPAERTQALAEEGLMEFEVGGNFGVSVVVRGPVANHAELEQAVLKLIQGMNVESGQTPE